VRNYNKTGPVGLGAHGILHNYYTIIAQLLMFSILTIIAKKLLLSWELDIFLEPFLFPRILIAQTQGTGVDRSSRTV
jgi:hypothetical protein